MTTGTGDGLVWLDTPAFPEAARTALADTQLRGNLRKATGTIRDKRLAVTGELGDWEQLRAAGAALKRRTLRHLDRYLVELEASVTRAGGTVHWAADADQATRIVTGLVQAAGADEVDALGADARVGGLAALLESSAGRRRWSVIFFCACDCISGYGTYRFLR